MSSPAQRSLALVRTEGYVAEVTERWNHWARIRQDLFGFIDLLAMRPTRGFLGVQTTSWANTSARIKKIASEPLAGIFLASGGSIQVHGWRKNKKTKRWECKCTSLDFNNGHQVEIKTIQKQKHQP